MNREIIRAIEQKEIPILRRRRIGGERKGLFFSISFARDDAKDETGNGENDRDGRGRKREKVRNDFSQRRGSFPFPFFYSFSREEYEKLRVKISARRSWNRIKKLAKPIKAFRESLRDSSRKRVSFPGARPFLFFFYYVAFRLVAELGAIKLFALPCK